MIDYTISDLEKMKRRIKRAGLDFLSNIFSCYNVKKGNDVLKGEDALLIFNTIGVTFEYIYLIANSHGMMVDEDEFNRLLDIQKEQSKNMRPAILQSKDE